MLKNLGFSYQKAALLSPIIWTKISATLGVPQTWPQVVRLAKERQALLLFGDEASFPQWGTLTYTWARRGQQLQRSRRSGKRKGYKVFGLIEYFTGRFFYQGQEERPSILPRILPLSGVCWSRTTQPILLIQDGARYHTSAETKAFFAQQTARLPSWIPVADLFAGLQPD